MNSSKDRILTTHTGSLARPDDLMKMLMAKERDEPYDQVAFAPRLREAVREVVENQVACGIDIVNDGEFSKVSWLSYFIGRLAGTEARDLADVRSTGWSPIHGRDAREFPEWFAAAGSTGYSWVLRLPALRAGSVPTIAGIGRRAVCTGPLSYIGQEETARDIANIKAAAEGLEVADLCLTSLGPTTLEYFLTNDYYSNDVEFVFAIAKAMREEYKAITDAGVILQVDEPSIITNWQIFPDMTLEQFRRWAMPRIEALNYALDGIPEDRVRMHCCWGSTHHTHKNDIPLEDVLDLLLMVKAQGLSLEASNPRHDHEWALFGEIDLPADKVVIPGVIGHYTDFVEHPRLVAERLKKYASVVGKENVIAGTDCGLGTRVGHPTVGWAKFEAMSEGARIASEQLWKEL